MPIDVIFVVDSSGSMRDNIKAVAQQLTQMDNVYKASNIDYAIGLTDFSTISSGNSSKQDENHIQVSQLITNITEYQSRFFAISASVTGNENGLDAIVQTIQQIKFRNNC